jgi:hypothetical protein
MDAAREEEGGNGLKVSASQPAVWPKNAPGDCWRLLDQPILTLVKLEMASVIAPVCEVRTN